MYTILSRWKHQNLLKIIISILFLNLLTIGLTIYFNFLFEKKEHNIEIEFIGNNEVNNLYKIFDEKVNFKLINKNIVSIISNHINENFLINKANTNIKDDNLIDNVGSVKILMNLNVTDIDYSKKLQKLNKDQILLDIQKYLISELENRNNKIEQDSKNLEIMSKYYLDYIFRNKGAWRDELKGAILGIVNKNKFNRLNNQRLQSIIKITKNILKNDFTKFFELNMTSSSVKKNRFDIIEAILAYLIVLNSLIFIFIKYYKFKK